MGGAVAGATTGAKDGVSFVDEDDAGGEFLREAEDGFDIFLAFTDVHVVHVCIRLVGIIKGLYWDNYQIR